MEPGEAAPRDLGEAGGQDEFRLFGFGEGDLEDVAGLGGDQHGGF